MSDVVYLQAWPGKGEPQAWRPSGTVDALTSSSRLTVAAAAERGTDPDERFGLLAWTLRDGRSLVGMGLVVPDGHPRAEVLRAWCAAQRFGIFDRPWTFETLREFCDPMGGRLIKLAYRRGAWVVCADLGRVLGLLAEPGSALGLAKDWDEPRGSYAGGFRLWPVAWSEAHRSADGKLRRRAVSPHVPSILVTTMGATGYRATFTRPGGPSCGKWTKEGRFRGRFFDVVGAAVPLDAIESATLADHAEAFGLGRVGQPAALPVDPEGAQELARTLDVVRRLSEALDEDGRKWLTTAREREEGRGRIDLRFTPSAGTLAARIEERSGASPMLWRPGAPDDRAMGHWIGAHHGGWLSAELAGAGLFPAADIDQRSSFPAMYALMGLVDLRHAERFEEEDVLADLLVLFERLAAGDVSPLFDPATWRRFGATLCLMHPASEDLAVQAPDDEYPEGHSAIRELICKVVPLPFIWCDAALAALRSHRVPDICSATRLVGVGVTPGIRACYPLYDGRWVRRGEDEAVVLAMLREEAKRAEKAAERAGDAALAARLRRLAADLRVVANSYVYGNLARIDPRDERRGNKTLPVEAVAPTTFPPIAASVPAACRLVTGVVEHLWRTEGYAVAYRDTDGLMPVCSPEGGPVVLDDGRSVQAGSWAALDRIMGRFDALAPFGPDVSFFKPALREKDGRALHGLVLRVKRYALGTLDDDGNLLELVEATEHGLGGQIEDPPSKPGHAEDGRHAWTREVAAEAMRRAIARRRGERRPVGRYAFDDGRERFPQLKLAQAASPRMLRQVERDYGLRLRPFGHYVQGTSLPPLGVKSAPPVAALDPGTDLADWQASAWHRQGCEVVRVTTDEEKRYERGWHVLASIEDKADRWMRPRALAARPVVVTDPRCIRLVGRSGRLLEVRAAGDDETPTEALRADYGDPAALQAAVVGRARAMGPAAFADAFGVPAGTAKWWASGRSLPSGPALRRLVPLLGRVDDCACGCGCPVAAGRRYVAPSHREAAKKRRQRARRSRGDQSRDALKGTEKRKDNRP